MCVISSRPHGTRAVLKFAHATGATPIAGRFTPGTFTNQIQKAFREPRLLVVTDPHSDHQVKNCWQLKFVQILLNFYLVELLRILCRSQKSIRVEIDRAVYNTMLYWESRQREKLAHIVMFYAIFCGRMVVVEVSLLFSFRKICIILLVDWVSFNYLAGCHWGIIREHPCCCPLQHWLSTASCWCCHSLQQQGYPLNWFDVVDACPWSASSPRYHHQEDSLGCHAWFVFLQRSRRGKSGYIYTPACLFLSVNDFSQNWKVRDAQRLCSLIPRLCWNLLLNIEFDHLLDRSFCCCLDEMLNSLIAISKQRKLQYQSK